MASVPHTRPSVLVERPLAAGLVAAVLTLPIVVFVSASTAASPEATLIGLVAIASVVVLLFRIETALLVLVAAGALEEAFHLSANSQITITKLAGAICFASFARYALTSRRQLILDGSHAVVVGILLLALASTVQAFDTTFAVTTATRYAGFVALYVIVSQFVGAYRLHRQIAWTLTGASAIAAFIGLHSYFSGETVVATLPYANPSDFAFILATTLPLTIWLLGSARRLRLPLVLATGLICAAIVLSLSRGTIVGIAAGIAWLVLVDRRHIRIVLGAGLLALLVAFLVIKSDPSRFETALVYKHKVADYNVTTRYDAWWAAGELATEKPLGVGPGNFRFYYNDRTGRPKGTHNLYVAHNAYLDMAAELGIGGMLLFLAYLGMMMRRLGVAAREGFGLPGYAHALRISMVIAMVSAIFVSEQYYPPFWLIGGLATAIWAERRRSAVVAEASPAKGQQAALEPDAGEYDPEVLERLEQREGRIKAQFQAIRAQQRRLQAQATALATLEGELVRRQAELDAASQEPRIALGENELARRQAGLDDAQQTRAAEQAALAAREAALQERVQVVTARELALARRAAALSGRERAFEPVESRPAHSLPQQREPELPVAAREPARTPQPVAARPEPEPLTVTESTDLPAASGPHPIDAPTAAEGWNVFELERLVAEHAAANPDRVDEWRAYAFELREFADLDGWLPDTFDSLAAEIFGELTEGLSTTPPPL